MASNPSMFSPIGVDAMTGGYFMVGGGGGMMSADVPHFHPSVLLEHGGFGFGLGDAAVGATATASDLAANNVMLASFASQLVATGPAPQDDLIAGRTPPEEMDEGYGADSGVSCVAANLQCPGHSGGAMAVWPSSSSKKPAGTWSSAGGSRAVSVHAPYHHLTTLPEVAGFHYPLAAAAAAAAAVIAPASSELSLTLCSKSSPDSALNAAGQCSSGASRSALTELHPRARSRPAAHFSVVVARSRYAAVAQEVLNDVVGHMLNGVADAAADSCSGIDGGGSAGAPSVVSSSNRLMASSEDAGERRGEAQRVKSDLLKLLQLMDEKYNQCLDEIQSTTAKFNALMHSGGGAGGGNGSICAPFAHRAVSAVYRGLRRRIAGQIVAAATRATGWGGESSSSVTAAGGDAERSWESEFIKKHWAAQQLRRGEQQCWRPQRGLPEKSVAVLKAWLFENFLHPYPKDHEKDVLAGRSGLTRNQVSNWFINARVRLWKPMIEEMYQDLKKSSGVGGQGPAMEPHTSKRRICELEGQ
ncbi:hypothetical protein SEVIR_1G031100v4 [Setaria viridis]|uniref:Homeobox domain-containing protein n=2 Tax=Setaria viridis TaxID=4556 RepID=A0A4U6WGT8_SETVI|nr:homeobox protein ATH1-like [Setaria viridis]XP_034570743.1 homeobox protein ATH1-like [Setaria viridis]XP_034570752.1 homeobox protein ATH1-like [Setaria viridis]XP_034570758.1 homeobox protein ATH1-like [Setaria viridis]XP_034570763.1 homeobox protein ATH1-like [Setaria viridis]XP_034570768.1 homeobox protein ATH1-like [Setaria viridis]XP_034570777.1 homeobox protein ATH1-like [Setaria viridis]XP_034570784.1 homeobox protein ATH1-like [Setaria viridis]XP_034570790.1 homeobox protein ATH